MKESEIKERLAVIAARLERVAVVLAAIDNRSKEISNETRFIETKEVPTTR